MDSYKIAAIDVHKSMLAVVVTDAAVEGELPFERRKFGALGSDLKALAEWLAALQVQDLSRLVRAGDLKLLFTLNCINRLVVRPDHQGFDSPKYFYQAVECAVGCRKQGLSGAPSGRSPRILAPLRDHIKPGGQGGVDTGRQGRSIAIQWGVAGAVASSRDAPRLL